MQGGTPIIPTPPPDPRPSKEETLPTEADGRAAFEATRKKGPDGEELYRVVMFKKTDAKRLEVFGVQMYEMEYEALVKRVRDYWVHGIHPLSLTPQRELPHGSWKKLEKGKAFKDTGTITFEKTENGWRRKTRSW